MILVTKYKAVLWTLIIAALFTSTVFAQTSKSSSSIKVTEIDLEKSYVAWVGKKITSEHSGKVNFKSGSVTTKNNVLAGGTFEIDMTTISDTDITNADSRAKLEKHLHSEDFFSTAAHPVATLKITKVLKLTKKSNSYNLTGDLTIKGITKSITFPATLKSSGNKFTGNAKLTIDRTLWDIRYGSSNFFEGLGDKAIRNDVELIVHVFSK